MTSEEDCILALKTRIVDELLAILGGILVGTSERASSVSGRQGIMLVAR